MLNYFKKRKNARHHRPANAAAVDGDDEHRAQSLQDELYGGGYDMPDNVAKRNSLKSTTSFCDEIFLEEDDSVSGAEGCAASLMGASILTDAEEDLLHIQSRLSLSMLSILNDQNCLSYFVQFLEATNALPLIKFYLVIENFKAAALAQLTGAKEEALNQAAEAELKSLDSSGHAADEQEKVAKAADASKVVPELKTLCDLSMRQPLTDDEKSQIYEETNKLLTNNNSNASVAAVQSSQQEVKQCETHAAAEPLPASKTEQVRECLEQPECGVSAASVKDAMEIFQTYLIGQTTQAISLPVDILTRISLLLFKEAAAAEQGAEQAAMQQQKSPSAQPISAHCFDEAQQHVLQQLEQHYFQDFRQSSYYSQYCLELLQHAQSSGSDLEAKLNVYDVLCSEMTLFYFMEFLEQRNERDCLDFWLAALNFQQSFQKDGARADTEARADAMIIYDKYFSLQSENRLWLSDRLRCKVEESICAETQVAKCFDLPLRITAKYLEQKYLRDFLNSPLFEHFVSELKQRAQEGLTKLQTKAANDSESNARTMPAQSAGHRKTKSDCSLDNVRPMLCKHISESNTLLAMESAHSVAAKQEDMSKLCMRSTSYLGNATAETNAKSGLHFGRISSLGRYERDFEAYDAFASAPKNSSWTLSGNKIKQAMRRLVNLPEEKVQEEIAWQVAEMIVKDVTSVTLGGADANC